MEILTSIYKVEITKSATKELSKLPINEAVRIVERLKELKNDPRPNSCIKLSGRKGEYRIRIGNYRALYTIKDKVLLVQVIKIGNRKDIY